MFSLRAPAARSSTRALLARRSLQTSATRFAGKESAQGNPQRAQEAEDAKHKQLNAQKQGKNEWDDTLASDSEAAIKGEKNTDSIQKLQEESAKKAQKGQ